MRGFDRDLIRGKHYGQRSCEPHLKAEHMAAPTKSATRRFFLPTRSRPHMAQSRHPNSLNECPLLGVKRTSHRLTPMSAFDPKRTLPSAVLTTRRLAIHNQGGNGKISLLDSLSRDGPSLPFPAALLGAHDWRWIAGSDRSPELGIAIARTVGGSHCRGRHSNECWRIAWGDRRIYDRHSWGSHLRRDNWCA